MKYTVDHMLSGTLEEALTIAKDRSRDIKVYPNISDFKIEKWEESDAVVDCQFLARGDGDIPKALQKLIKPEMVSWREFGHWDKKNNIYDYYVKTFYFTNMFVMKGKFTFTPKGDKVHRHLDGEIRINIPILGEIAAKTIVKYQIENLDKEAKIFDKDLEELRKKKK